MNKNKIVFVIASGVVAYTAHSFFEHRQQRARMTHEDIRDIWTAAGRVKEKIARGDYRDKSLDDVMSDFEFYKIAENLEK